MEIDQVEASPRTPKEEAKSVWQVVQDKAKPVEQRVQGLLEKVGKN